jgi:hypothetical protein
VFLNLTLTVIFGVTEVLRLGDGFAVLRINDSDKPELDNGVLLLSRDVFELESLRKNGRIVMNEPLCVDMLECVYITCVHS